MWACSPHLVSSQEIGKRLLGKKKPHKLFNKDAHPYTRILHIFFRVCFPCQTPVNFFFWQGKHPTSTPPHTSCPKQYVQFPISSARRWSDRRPDGTQTYGIFCFFNFTRCFFFAASQLSAVCVPFSWQRSCNAKKGDCKKIKKLRKPLPLFSPTAGALSFVFNKGE